MNNVIKKSKFILGFSFCLYTVPCVSLERNSNFVLVSSHVQPSFVEYKSHTNNVQPERLEVQQQLHKVDTKCDGIFSFYASSNSVTPKIIAQKNNTIFLYTDNNKLVPLGEVLSLENKDLGQMENSVAEGKLLIGYKNKFHRPVAFVQDKGGVVYSVTRISKQHYSIQSLGTLAFVDKS
jgi:hypothetical protein